MRNLLGIKSSHLILSYLIANASGILHSAEHLHIMMCLQTVIILSIAINGEKHVCIL